MDDEQWEASSTRLVRRAYDITKTFTDTHCVFGPDEHTTKNAMCSLYKKEFEPLDPEELCDMACAIIPRTRGMRGLELRDMFENVLRPLLLWEKRCSFGDTSHSSLSSDFMIWGVSVTPRVEHVERSPSNRDLVVESLLLRVQQQQDQIAALTLRMDELYHAPGMPGFLTAMHRFKDGSSSMNFDHVRTSGDS